MVLAKKLVCQALQSINSTASNQRKVKTGRLLRSRVYRLKYFGHKIHYDLNKNLEMHAAVRLFARDGQSGMIAEFAKMALKIISQYPAIFICMFFRSLLLHRQFLCFFAMVQISKIALLNYLVFCQGEILWIFLIVFMLFRQQYNAYF